MSQPRDQAGMNTAEYAVGTVAATGFAATLWGLWPLFDAVLHLLYSVALRGPKMYLLGML